jgi:hypothetical protein
MTVMATIRENATAVAMARARSRKSCPASSWTKTMGTKTASVVSVEARIAPQTSLLPIVGRLAAGVALLDAPVDVLEHDDRVVDDHAHREGESRERDDVERPPRPSRTRNVPMTETGNTGRDDDRGPAVPQEQQQDENGQTAADEQVRRHEIARGEDVVRLVVDDLQLDVAALVEAVQARDLGLQPLDHVDDVRAGPAQDAERDRRLAVLAEDEGALGVGIADLGHVFQVDGPPFAA